MSSSKPNQSGIPNRRPLAPGAGEASNNGRRRTALAEAPDQRIPNPPTSMPPAEDLNRGLLTREDSDRRYNQNQIQRSNGQGPSQPRRAQTVGVPAALPSPPPSQATMDDPDRWESIEAAEERAAPTPQPRGNIYGNIIIGGRSRAVIGSASDGNNPMAQAMMPINEYKQIQTGEDTAVVIGNTDHKGLEILLGWNTGGPGAPSRSNTT